MITPHVVDNYSGGAFFRRKSGRMRGSHFAPPATKVDDCLSRADGYVHLTINREIHS